jgi:hypothetical protein
MLTAFNRRVPRTKSVLDRTSSRRYSSVDYDSNGFYDHEQERMIIDNNNNQDIRHNHLNLIDLILRQHDDAIVSSNGHDDLTVSFDGDDDSDEYACFILHRYFFFPCIYHHSFFLFCLDASSSSLLLLIFHKFIIDEKIELKVRQVNDKVCEETQQM